MQKNEIQNIEVNPQKKKFLLIYIAMYTGGIETLILRMTDWLIDSNHEVDILLVKNQGELLSDINKNANVYSLETYTELSFLLNYIYKKQSSEYNVIYSFSPVTIWMALLLGQRQKIRPIILNGVYHLYDFQLFGDRFTKKLFDTVLPDICKVFMTPYVKIEHEKIFGRMIHNPIIWPLPIKGFHIEDTIRTPKQFKVVSIGRLTEFKTYNLYMLDVIKELINQNYNMEYYIYGDGELFNKVKKRISELKLKSHVHLCGTINYNKIPEILSDAYAFIGMGTSVIEAGMCKVPSIVAIAYSETAITHGLVHELPDFNSGEFREQDPVYNVVDQLKTLFNYSPEEYNKICDETLVKLKSEYDIDHLMNDLLLKINHIIDNECTIAKINIPYDYILVKSIKRVIMRIRYLIKKVIGLSPKNE